MSHPSPDGPSDQRDPRDNGGDEEDEDVGVMAASTGFGPFRLDAVVTRYAYVMALLALVITLTMVAFWATQIDTLRTIDDLRAAEAQHRATERMARLAHALVRAVEPVENGMARQRRAVESARLRADLVDEAALLAHSEERLDVSGRPDPTPGSGAEAEGLELAARTVAALPDDAIRPDHPAVAHLLAAGDSATARSFAARARRLAEDARSTAITVIVIEGVLWISAVVMMVLIAFVVYRPLTQRIRRQLTQLRGTYGALEEEQRKVQSLLEGAPDATIVINQRGTIVRVNEAAEVMFGYDRSTFEGLSIEALVPNEVRAGHVTLRQDLAAKEVRRVMGATRAIEAVRQDGSRLPVEINLNIVHQADGPEVIATVRDITKRIDRESKLREALAEADKAREAAEKANQATNGFLSNISHELYTPLNAIMGFAQVLEMDPKGNLSPPQRANLMEIIQAGDHLLALITAILDLINLDSGQLTLDPEPVEALPLLVHAVGMAAPASVAGDISVEVVEPPADALPCPPLRANPDRLRQVLSIVVDNAVKYNRRGGRVTLERTVLPDGRCRLTVADTGSGLPEGWEDGLFEPLNRLGRENSAVTGTGIGLALAKKLVEAMDGTLTAENRPGQGSAFHITLPRAQ